MEHYPFRFVKKDVEAWQGLESFMTHRLLYSFKSTKTNQAYWVWVECYQHHFYAVKFHLKNHRNSEQKYNVMTGLHEARQCIKTVMAIMNTIAEEDSKASFGFIGANMPGESEAYTKRFRVYERYMVSYFDTILFKHIVNYQKSAYLLLSRSYIDEYPNLLADLTQGFRDLYDYFE